MKEAVGAIKSTSENAISIDGNGNATLLQVGDSIYLGDVIKNQANNGIVEIDLTEGNSLSINNGKTLLLDKSVISEESFGDECSISQNSILDDFLLSSSHSNDAFLFAQASIEENIQTDF